MRRGRDERLRHALPRHQASRYRWLGIESHQEDFHIGHYLDFVLHQLGDEAEDPCGNIAFHGNGRLSFDHCRTWSRCGWIGNPTALSTFTSAPCVFVPARTTEKEGQAEGLRGLFVLPFALRLLRGLKVGGDGVEAFRTSSTTSCHQCSAGALSSPSSRWRVSVNCGSWCHASQFARVLHVPDYTLLSSLSAGRRSCPPIQPDASLAADRRVRMAASQSRPAPALRCTCVTIVIIRLALLTPRVILLDSL
jgi:hypothetical protein